VVAPVQKPLLCTFVSGASVISEGKIPFILYVSGSRQRTIIVCFFKAGFLLKENSAPYSGVVPFLI